MGVGRQAAVAHGVVEHGAQLVAHRAEVRVLIGQPVRGFQRPDGVLPAEDVERRDLGEPPLTQVRRGLRLDDLLLVALRDDAQLLLQVALVELAERIGRLSGVPSIWRRKSTSHAAAVFLVLNPRLVFFLRWSAQSRYQRCT